MMPDRLKSMLQRSRLFMIGRYVQANMCAAIRQKWGSYVSMSGATHRRYAHDVDSSVAYVNTVFKDYLLYGGIGPDDLRGWTVLEVGPGDDLGVALKFIAKGAARVVCLDRFYSDRDDAQHAEIYRALLATFGKEERRRAESAVDISANSARFEPTKIEYVSDIAVEDALPRFQKESFDLIVSRAVLEHVFDLDRAFRNMDAWLKDGGLLLHKVDLRPHSLFPAHSNPLTFLTVPSLLWPLMTSHTGTPNRKRINYYQEKFKTLGGYESRIYLTHIFGNPREISPHKSSIQFGEDYDATNVDLVRRVRKKLAREFRSLPDEELLIAGIFVCARKGAPSHPA